VTAIAHDYELGLPCPDCGHTSCSWVYSITDHVLTCDGCERPHAFVGPLRQRAEDPRPGLVTGQSNGGNR
jgi:hypothetical protein